MSTYNNANYIRKSINSVLEQSYTEWEFVIINDASTDNTDEIIKEYVKKNKRIRYIHNIINKGLVANLNLGISISSGSFIARIDDDDIWVDKNKLKEQIEFMMRNRDYGLVGSLAKAISGEESYLYNINLPKSDLEIRERILTENCFIHSAVLIRKKIINKLGGYSLKYPHIEDYDLWLKVGKISKFYNLPKYFVNYRIRRDNITHTHYVEQIECVLKLIKQFKKVYPNYLLARSIWSIRKYYPYWARININKIKNILIH